MYPTTLLPPTGAAQDSSQKINTVVNQRMDEAIVVHQYDRLPALSSHYFAEWVPWDVLTVGGGEGSVPSGPSGYPLGEGSCSLYEIAPDKDLFMGLCDLGPLGPAPNHEECCRLCEITPACFAFTLVRTTCFLKTQCAPMARNNIKVFKPGATSGWKTRTSY